MKKVILTFLVIFVTQSLPHRSRAENAAEFMQRLGNQVLDITERKDGEERRSSLQSLFEAYIHHKKIAQFVLGKARRSLRGALKEVEDIEEEKKKVKKEIQDTLEDFYTTYRESIVRIYLSSFEKKYEGMTFKVVDSKPNGQEGMLVSSTLDRHNETPPLSLHWILVPSDEGDGKTPWKIVDLRVEGVSQAEKERSETSSVFSTQENQCRSSGSKLCALQALKTLTLKHKSLNERWRKRVKYQKDSSSDSDATREE